MIFEGFIKTVANVFDAHTACLLSPIKKKESEPLSVISWHSLSNNFNPSAKINKGEGLIGWVYKEKQPLHFNHFERDPQLLVIYNGELQIKAIMMAPIPDNRGVLLVDSKNRYAFPPKSNKLLLDFANLANELLISLEGRAELLFLRRFRDLLLDENNKLDVIITNFINFVGLDSAVIVGEKRGGKDFEILFCYNIKEQDFNLIKEYSINKGLVSWVLRNRKSIFISLKEKKEIKTFLFHEREGIDASFFMGIFFKRREIPHCLSIFGDKKRIGINSKSLPLIERTWSLMIKDEFFHN